MVHVMITSKQRSYLPHCYLPSEELKKIPKTISDQKLEFPKKFVLCCFNQSYKILPETFNTWMKILKKVSGSVLWLFETNEISCKKSSR